MTLLSLEIDSIPPMSRTLVSHILLAVCLSLVWHWKDTVSPDLKDIVQTTNTYSTYETPFASSNGKYSSSIKH